MINWEDSSPATTATIASSSRAKPSATRRVMISVAPKEQRGRDEVDVGEAFADLQDAGRRGVERRPVTGLDEPKHGRDEQVPPLGAVPLDAVEDPVGPAEPPTRPGEFPHVGEPEADSHRAPTASPAAAYTW